MRDKAIEDRLTDLWGFREMWGFAMMFVADQEEYFGAPSEYLQYLTKSLLSSVYYKKSSIRYMMTSHVT